MSKSVRLVGFRRLQRNLDMLADDLRANVQIESLKESAEPMLAEYRAGAPQFLKSNRAASGRFTRGIKIRVMRNNAKNAEIALGSRHPLAHIFEFGTVLRRTGTGTAQGKRGRLIKIKTGTGASRGRIQQMGFARRAFDTNVDRWFRLIGKILWREVKRARR